MFSLESPHRGDSNKYTQNTISQYEKGIHPTLSLIVSYEICSKGLKNEFKTAIVNVPSVFEPLKFFCIYIWADTGGETLHLIDKYIYSTLLVIY